MVLQRRRLGPAHLHLFLRLRIGENGKHGGKHIQLQACKSVIEPVETLKEEGERALEKQKRFGARRRSESNRCCKVFGRWRIDADADDGGDDALLFVQLLLLLLPLCTLSYYQLTFAVRLSECVHNVCQH